MKIRLPVCSAWLLALTVTAAYAAPADPPDAKQELREVYKLTPSVGRGAELFRNCVTCHGTAGNGLPQGDVPAIAQQHQRVIAKQLIDYRHAERWDPLMEEVVSRHGLSSAQDVADVAAYVAAQRRDNAQTGLGDGKHVDLGARLYLRDCSGCHGADGEGNGVLLVPRLAGQHYKYVLRQLHDTLEQRRPNMPPPHPQLFDPLQVDELTGLADYLARLQAPRRVLSP